MLSLLFIAAVTASPSFIRHDLSTVFEREGSENGSYVRFVHPTHSLPFEPDMPVYVEVDVQNAKGFCLEIRVSGAGAHGVHAAQRLSQIRPHSAAWTWRTAFQFSVQGDPSEEGDSRSACPRGPCSLHIDLLEADADVDCLATPYKQLKVLATDTVHIVAMDADAGSMIDCDFGRHEAALSTLPLQFMDEHSRTLLGCLRSCHLRDVCVRHPKDAVPHFFVIHGERLKHGSDLWKLPPPHLGLCSNFMQGTPPLEFTEVDRLSSNSHCQRTGCVRVREPTIVHHARLQASKNLWHLLFEELSAVWGFAEAVRTLIGTTTGVMPSSVRMLLSDFELEDGPYFTGLDYSSVASILPHSEYTCFDDLFVGSNLFSLFTAGQNVDRGGRHTPQPDMYSHWSIPDVLRFRSRLLRQFGIVPSASDRDRDGASVAVLRRKGESRDVINFDEMLRVLEAELARRRLAASVPTLEFRRGMTVASQATMVAALDMLVGTLGAGLSHVFFMRPGSAVVVIILNFMRYARRTWAEYARLAEFTSVEYSEFWADYAAYQWQPGPYQPYERTPHLLNGVNGTAVVTLRRTDTFVDAFFFRTNLFVLSMMRVNATNFSRFVADRLERTGH
jgi:hypothetical protein